jgi:hypothetical protein
MLDSLRYEKGTPKTWYSRSVKVSFSALGSTRVRAPRRFSVIADSQSRASLHFAFLNRGDGAEITILHTGPSTVDPRLEGAVIGGAVLRASSSGPRPKPIGVVGALYSLFLVIALPAMAAFTMALQTINFAKYPEFTQALHDALTHWVVVSLFVVVLGSWCVVIYHELRSSAERAVEPLDMTPLSR